VSNVADAIFPVCAKCRRLPKAWDSDLCAVCRKPTRSKAEQIADDILGDYGVPMTAEEHEAAALDIALRLETYVDEAVEDWKADGA